MKRCTLPGADDALTRDTTNQETCNTYTNYTPRKRRPNYTHLLRGLAADLELLVVDLHFAGPLYHHGLVAGEDLELLVLEMLVLLGVVLAGLGPDVQQVVLLHIAAEHLRQSPTPFEEHTTKRTSTQRGHESAQVG